jgi:hypothetical protein
LAARQVERDRLPCNLYNASPKRAATLDYVAPSEAHSHDSGKTGNVIETHE